MSREIKDPIDEIPSRVRYYLLEWKDKYMEDFQNKFGEVRLRDLTKHDLQILFIHATTKDIKTLN